MLIFMCFIAIAAPFALFVMIFIWKDSTGKYPRIKFNDFKKFYAFNPNRWYIYNDKVECRLPRSNSWFSDNERFGFNFTDYYKYKLWYRDLNKKQKNDSNAKATQRMLDAVQEDIKKHQSDAELEITDSLRSTIDALNKLKMNDTALSLIKILKQIEEPQSNDTKLTE